MTRSDLRTLLAVGAGFLLALAVCYALPVIALDTGFADLTVRFTDTGSIRGMPFLIALIALMFVFRPSDSARGREAAIAVVVLLAVGMGIAGINEFGVKPVFAEPRPNIEALAASGLLGATFPDGESFYETTGGKGERRQLLAGLLPGPEQLGTTERVRDHWIHETGYSFPSGHSTSATAMATIAAVLGAAALGGWRRVIALYCVPVWALLVGYSRVLLEVHRPIDVLAGAVLGITVGLGGAYAIARGVARQSSR